MGYLKNALIALVNNRPRDWDVYLAAVLFAYRSAPHSETGESPFFLNTGRDPDVPEAVTLNVPSTTDVNHTLWYDQLCAARNTLQEKIQAQQERVQLTIDAQESMAYQTDQLVLVKRTPAELQQAHSKLTDKYDHPARIKQVLPTGVAFEVQFLESGNTAVVNRRRLRPFYCMEDDEDEALAPAHTPTLPLAKV